jgi:Ca-activated chloride channel family protein
MTFGNPMALWALAALPILAWLGMRALRRRREIAGAIGQTEVVARLHAGTAAAWRARRAAGGLAVFALLAIAAARPQYGRIEQTMRRRGIDVLIAVDSSASMLAQDVRPNRLKAAKDGMRRLISQLGTNRVGAIDFSGEAFLRCPLTLDHSLAHLVIEAIDVETIGTPGTDLGRAIDVALESFERAGSRGSALVLITDGEDNEGRGLSAARRAAEKGVRIFAIGIGTEEGALVPDGRGGFKDRPEGGKVVSRLDLNGIERIAEAAGGVALSAERGVADAVNRIARQIDRMEKQNLESRRVIVHQDRFSWFVAPAILLMLWMVIARPERIERVRTLNAEMMQ